MYDLAKRSLAFTVATGGLLLTGTAYTPALAAAGVGGNQGPAQAQGVQSDLSSPVTTAGSPGDVQAPPDLLAPSALNPQPPAPKPRQASSGPGATATSNTDRSGGIASGNTIQIPINLGLELCGNNVKAASVHDHSGGGDCSMPSGSSATSTTSHSGGILSGNSVQAPINAPILACDNNVLVVASHEHEHGAKCTAPGGDAAGGGGSSANQTTDHSGGILSGNIIQAPVNVPVNACGNNVNAGVVHSTESGSSCTNSAEGSAPTTPGAPASGSGGASATAASVNNGGIGSGWIVQTPINVPVNVCGNTANGLAAHDDVDGGTCSINGGGASAVAGANGNGGVLSGNIAQTPINVPANVCGNEALVGAVRTHDHNPNCSTTTPGTSPSGSTAITVSSNNGGVGSGNSVQTPINVPANVCANNVTVAGAHNTQGGGECTNATGTTIVTVTTNNGGVGSGNNVPVPVNVPVSVCGNSVTGGGVENNQGGSECTNTPPSNTNSTPPVVNSTPPTGASTPPIGASTPPTGASTPPTGPSTPPGGPSTPPGGGHLAHTGAELGVPLGVAGAAMLAGAGLLVASRRRERGEHQ